MAIRRFTRALGAVFMALTLAATVDLSPAAAAAKPAAVKPNVDPATIPAIIKQLYSLHQQYFGAKGRSLTDATAQIINAINAAEAAFHRSDTRTRKRRPARQDLGLFGV
jgi:hypothetical protein